MITDALPIDFLWSFLCAMSVAPVGYMLGSSCSPCCGPQGCGVSDGKPRTDPATEGHWVPSGTWATGVTWTFSSSPSTTDGGTWFFYGSLTSSKPGGSASLAEMQDWGNICNWYSNKTTTPSSILTLTTVLNKRATRLPPADAIVHIYGSVNTNTTGPVIVKNAFFWGGPSSASFVGFVNASELTATSSAHDSLGGCVFNRDSRNTGNSTVNGGATFNGTSSNVSSSVNGGATFNGSSSNISSAIVNDGATFNDSSSNISSAIVNGGATFNDSSGNKNSGIVNGGATFNDSSENRVNSIVNGGATFNDYSLNTLIATVNDGATFYDFSRNVQSLVYGSATFNGSSLNDDYSTVNDGATFNDSSENGAIGTVNGGATFNDAACSSRTVGSFGNCPAPGKRIFVAHPTDLPTCNGTAPDGCANAADTCGCG